MTYQSSTAWRSTTDLYADGTEFADTSRQIAACEDDNAALPYGPDACNAAMDPK